MDKREKQKKHEQHSKQEKQELYESHAIELENEKINSEPENKTANTGRNTRKINLNPVTARQAMVLSVIIGPAVSKGGKRNAP